MLLCSVRPLWQLRSCLQCIDKSIILDCYILCYFVDRARRFYVVPYGFATRNLGFLAVVFSTVYISQFFHAEMNDKLYAPLHFRCVSAKITVVFIRINAN